VLSTSPAGRATIWLLSVCVHTAAFFAASGTRKHAGAESPAATELSIDVAAAPAPASDDDPPIASVVAAVSAVPPARATRSIAGRPPAIALGPIGSAGAGEAAVSPSDLPIAAAAPARFTLRVESGTTNGAGAPSAEMVPGSDAVPLPEDGVSSPARLAGVLSPQYPPRARDAEIEADVVLSLVVNAAGDVADVRVVRPAGFGFDESALRAARVARFAPATRDGRRVAVRMRWTVSFRLR
jgi:TonB family protein